MDETIHTILVVIECHISHAQSLKQKRAEIKGLIDKLRARLNASVSETGYLDEWQRSVIAISMVSNSKRYLQKQTGIVEQIIIAAGGNITVSNIETHWL